MRRKPLYPPRVMRWIEARNQENLVYCFYEELLRVRDFGERPDTHKTILRRLKKGGLLTTNPRYNKVGRVWTYSLTEKCLRIVEDMENSQKMTQKSPMWAVEHAPEGRIDPASAEASFSIKEVKSVE